MGTTKESFGDFAAFFGHILSVAPRGYMTCGWTGVYRPVLRKATSSNCRSLPSYPLLSKIGMKCFSRIFALAPWRETFKSSFSRTIQTANIGRQNKCVKIFPIVPTFIKRNQDKKKLLEISRTFLKKSTRQMFWYPGLVAGLNISWFLGVMALLKPMRY